MAFWTNIFKRSAPPRRRALPARGRRNFAGAKGGNLLYKWTTTPRTPDEVLAADLRPLRARSRDSFHNNDFVRRFVGLVKGNIIGPRGVVLQAQSIGYSGMHDRPANDAIEEAWRDWCRPENCDFYGRLAFVEMQRQAIASAAIDGEILARKITGKAAGKFGLLVQHMDPESLDSDYNAELRNSGGVIRLGIEYDSNGRVAAYHIRSSSDDAYRAPNGNHYVRVPAREIIHAYLPEQVNQGRGYPWISTALQRLKMLDGYYEAALVAARAGASKMGFITSTDGEYVGDDVDADGATVAEFEAGIIENLRSGETFQAFDPRYPHEQFGQFVKTCLQAIGGSLGVSYVSLSNDLEGVNYSSIRAGVLEEREAWKALQEWFIDAYLRPVFEAWMREARLRDAITVFGVPLSGPEEKYGRVSWQARRWAWVDPQKDMNASIMAINNNITTVSAVIREAGKDPEEVFQERAKEKARLAELGLTVAEVVNNV